MKVRIKKVTPKPFTGGGGEEIAYYWHKALVEDGRDEGLTITFGSKTNHSDDIDNVIDLDIEKHPSTDGKGIYKESLEE